MGNKLGRRRQVVDEKYTKPQGLYQHKDVDHKKLRKLILDSKLAPCYPGDDDTDCDLEECPICFLYYPSLNRSRCCTKGICTECFLQMKTPNSTRPTQCPFCKTLNYAVEYRGMKTKEEKGNELIEEQRVIEANIRMRQQEQQEEEERMQKRQEIISSSRIVGSGEVEYCSIAEPSSAVEGEEMVSAQHTSAAPSIRQPLRPRQNREDEFDLDLEDIMVVEAIWLSIQEEGRHRNPSYGDAAPLEQYVSEDGRVTASMAPLTETALSSSSPSGGLACAIAALAERQQVGGDSSSNYNGNTSAYNMLPESSRVSNREDQVSENYPSTGGSIVVSPNIGEVGEWTADHGSEVAEVGTSYAGSETAEDVARNTAFPQPNENGSSGFQTVVPENFEEQMMLAMVVSLAEA